MAGAKQDLKVRLAEFEWLARPAELRAVVLPRSIIGNELQIDGKRVTAFKTQRACMPPV